MNHEKNIRELNEYSQDHDKDIVVHKGKIVGFSSRRRGIFGLKR